MHFQTDQSGIYGKNSLHPSKISICNKCFKYSDTLREIDIVGREVHFMTNLKFILKCNLALWTSLFLHKDSKLALKFTNKQFYEISNPLYSPSSIVGQGGSATIVFYSQVKLQTIYLEIFCDTGLAQSI